MRYFIRIAFKGTRYHGWQIQENAVSVQSEINRALAVLAREEISTTGCGRTDTGVHAPEFFAHFDSISLPGDLSTVIHQLNCMLPDDIVIHNMLPMPDGAHARYDALERTYEYHLHTEKSVFNIDTSWYYHGSPDMDHMNQLSRLLLLVRNFSAFRKSGSSPNNGQCMVRAASWGFSEEGLVFRITADRFLRNMVRSIVGTLLEAGREKLSQDKFLEQIHSGDRSRTGPSVPAHGLRLVRVSYPYPVP